MNASNVTFEETRKYEYKRRESNFYMFLKSKGFTLIEVLIVIIIIGILAGGMMLSVGNATDTAKASVLVSDLRNAKSAGIFWFADNSGSPDAVFLTAWNDTTMRPVMTRYLDNPEIAARLVFRVTNPGNEGAVFLVGKSADKRVIEKALGISRIILLDGNALPSIGNESIVYIRVR